MDKRIKIEEFMEMFKTKIIEKDIMREEWYSLEKEQKEDIKKQIEMAQRWCYSDMYLFINQHLNKYILKNFINLTKVTDIIDDIGDKQKFVQSLQNTLWGKSNHEYFYEDNKRFAEWLGIDLKY